MLKDVSHTRDIGLDNAVSSIRILRGPNFPPTGCKAIFFEQPSFEGANFSLSLGRLEFEKSMPDLHTHPQRFGDIISSVKIAPTGVFNVLVVVGDTRSMEPPLLAGFTDLEGNTFNFRTIVINGNPDNRGDPSRAISLNSVDLSEFDIIWLTWNAPGHDGQYFLEGAESAIRDFVANGGTVWASAMDNNIRNGRWRGGWLPVENHRIRVVNSSDTGVLITAFGNTSGLFSQPNRVNVDALVTDDHWVTRDKAYQHPVVDADQKKIIRAYSATRKAEGTKVQYEQEAIGEKARIAKDQTIMEREIEKNRYVQVAEIERNLVIQQVTFDAQVGIKEAEVDSLKKQYIFEKDRAVVDADQKKIIQAYSAARKAEGTKVQYEQEAVEKKAMIAKDQTIMEREIQKDKYVETAMIEMGQAVQVREIERNLQVQKVTFEAQVGIKHADVDSQIKQFALEQDRSWAEADQRKQIAAYVAQRQAEAAKIQYEQDVIKETARISREQTVVEREIQKDLVVETARIAMGKQVMQVEIDQQLVVGLADEDRKIQMEMKMKQTDLATKEHLEATAVKNVADVHAITVERVGEAERDKEVAVINAEREAKPMERLADAILAQAKAKAEGEMKMIEAKNVTEQRVLVQQAILSLIETSPQIVERLMKPVEKIESIRILDMGDRGAGGGLDKSAMGKIATNLLDTGSVMPMVKEFLKFADVDADDLAKKAAEYLSGLVKIQPKE